MMASCTLAWVSGRSTETGARGASTGEGCVSSRLQSSSSSLRLLVLDAILVLVGLCVIAMFLGSIRSYIYLFGGIYICCRCLEYKIKAGRIILSLFVLHGCLLSLFVLHGCLLA